MYGTEGMTAEELFYCAQELQTNAWTRLEEELCVYEDKVDYYRSKVEELDSAMQLKDKRLLLAYSQRAIAACVLAHVVLSNGGSAGVGRDDREDQPDAWRVVLYVDTPAGQFSWHIAPADQHMLVGLPQYAGSWDGTYNSSDVDAVKAFRKV